MSINTDVLIDAVLAAGCEFYDAQNISDHDEVKKILQQCDATWILLPKGFPWTVAFTNDYAVARSAISIEKIGGCKNWGEWRICGVYSNVIKHNDFTLELAADYDTKLFSSYDGRFFTSRSSRDRIPENGIELKATLDKLLEKVREASKELNIARIRSCAEEFEV